MLTGAARTETHGNALRAGFFSHGPVSGTDWAARCAVQARSFRTVSRNNALFRAIAHRKRDISRWANPRGSEFTSLALGVVRTIGASLTVGSPGLGADAHTPTS